MDQTSVPKHIAIIMDGNRRWAKARGITDIKGHEAGHEALEKTIRAAMDFGVKTLTVYALSTENIKERSKQEMAGLFNLLRTTYQTKLKKMMEEGVEVDILGEIIGLPVFVKNIIGAMKKKQLKQAKFKLNIAFNYGGKKELVKAIKDIVKAGVDVGKINEQIVERHLYTNGQADPELVIRTGGRSRLSNFLLWQTAYSEFYFTKTLWPDFDGRELKKAILWYQAQKRNFGK